ncbi:M23 peptidase domain protein [Stigmatella aurantiaca DW4/3-1]|uniref:M23 peptidase domain protein n=1 Tax=Stigmatella aurantiaca (strain DW4/3-1) TaxID=378806 RepID=E3FM66_STIAD|nr:M23 peptidase domain protein [Stigmatella aurantiaca DW4/3-1]
MSHPETDHGRILLSGTEQTTRGGLNRRTLLTGSGALAALSFGGTLMAPRIASAAGGYIYPTSSRRVSDSFADHVARGSVNPGTDYVCPTGTRVVAVKAGTVVGITNTIGGSGGRMVFIDHPDGSKTDYLHLSVIQVGLGAQVAQGQQIALSGGSGNGSENGYGAHLHLSLHVGAGAQHATRGGSVDFEAYVGEGGSSAPGPLRQVYSTNAGASWQSGDTGLLFNPSQLSAVNMGGAWPQLMMTQAGVLYQVYGTSSGWTFGNTGVASNPTSMSAVNMGGSWPTVMSIENSTLFQTVGTSSGWQKLSTGQTLIGQISAVNMGGSWPTIMLAQGGVLYHVYGTTAGWKVASTGISINGQISAVNMGGGVPQVMAIENGYLYQIWGDSAGWHKQSTGLNLIGQISAVATGGTWPTVMLDQGGALYRVWGDASGWHVQPTGIAGTGRFSAVDMGGGAPQVLKIG